MREILIKPELYKFKTFAEFAKEFNLGKDDLIFTNEFIYTPFMKDLNLECQYVFQEKFGLGEPSEEMIEAIFAAMDKLEYSRVIAIGGGAIMDLGKLLSLKRTGTVHELFFKKCEVCLLYTSDQRAGGQY